MAERQSSEQSENETEQTEFEVGVEGRGSDFEHVSVEAESPEEALQEGRKKVENSIRYDLEEPLNAYQAYDLENHITHTP